MELNYVELNQIKSNRIKLNYMVSLQRTSQ